MNDRVDSLRQRWQALAPREQWLCLLVGLTVLSLLYVLLVADPLTRRNVDRACHGGAARQ